MPTCKFHSPTLPFLLPFTAGRHAASKSSAPAVSAKEKRRKEKQKYFKREDMAHAQTYSLCDAMRYDIPGLAWPLFARTNLRCRV